MPATPLPVRSSCPATAARAAALLLGVTLCVPAPAIAECSASIVTLSWLNGPFSTTASVYDSTDTTPYPAHVTFDRMRLRLSLSGYSYGRYLIAVRVVDRFDLAGVPPGTAVSATLELHTAGQTTSCSGHGCGVEFRASLRAGADSLVGDASGEGPGVRVLPTHLKLPVTLVAGSPLEAQFFMHFATGPAGAGTVDASATWEFSGLPSGVQVLSCSGSDITPVRTGSWGALKIRYR